MNYLLCIDNTDYEESLERLKLYQVLPDEHAEQHGMVRVIDEDQEDYLFERSRFLDLKLDASVVNRLSNSAT